MGPNKDPICASGSFSCDRTEHGVEFGKSEAGLDKVLASCSTLVSGPRQNLMLGFGAHRGDAGKGKWIRDGEYYLTLTKDYLQGRVEPLGGCINT